MNKEGKFTLNSFQKQCATRLTFRRRLACCFGGPERAAADGQRQRQGRDKACEEFRTAAARRERLARAVAGMGKLRHVICMMNAVMRIKIHSPRVAHVEVRIQYFHYFLFVTDLCTLGGAASSRPWLFFSSLYIQQDRVLCFLCKVS